jgi:hypothetical protein
MKRNQKWSLGLLSALLACGIILAGCGGSTPSNPEPKTLVVSGIPKDLFDSATYSDVMGVFPVGTTTTEAVAMTDLVAGANLSNNDIVATLSGDTYNVAIPLFLPSSDIRWTGSGDYDMYSTFGGKYYKAGSISISSATTTVNWSSVTEVFP